MQLLTAKPVVFLVNVSKRDYLRKANKYLPKIAEYVTERGGGEQIIPLSCEFELELLDLDAGGQLAEYQKENPTHKSVLNRILKMGYHALGLIHFFTAGKDEVRGWTIRKGRLAPQAAGVIHTDFEKGFIMAEVQAFADLKERTIYRNGSFYIITHFYLCRWHRGSCEESRKTQATRKEIRGTISSAAIPSQTGPITC